MLTLRDVAAGYGGATVLQGVELNVEAGETVALVGANGAGKSTLLKVISGLVRVTSGEVRFDERPLARVPAPARVRLGIAHVPEGRDVFAGLSVRDNLLLGAYAQRRAIGEAERGHRLDEVLSRFPALRARLNAPAADLSGGQQQMLAIGRGLMGKPRLLLLDEPSLGLSPSLVTEIFDVVRSLRELGTAILIAEQNARMTLAVADRGYVLENGRIALHGAGRTLLESPDVIERYLGIGAGSDLREDADAVGMTRRLTAIFAAVTGRHQSS
ncbi:MAG: ABC transporter ATP-binding protein [Candidatus Velthaea sp.]